MSTSPARSSESALSAASNSLPQLPAPVQHETALAASTEPSPDAASDFPDLPTTEQHSAPKDAAAEPGDNQAEPVAAASGSSGTFAMDLAGEQLPACRATDDSAAALGCVTPETQRAEHMPHLGVLPATVAELLQLPAVATAPSFEEAWSPGYETGTPSGASTSGVERDPHREVLSQRPEASQFLLGGPCMVNPEVTSGFYM